MTTTPQIIGPKYDSDATLPDSVFGYEAKRDLALAALRRAEEDSDDEVVRLLYWELGLIDLDVSTDGDPSPYGGGAYDAFAAFYRITDETVAYARERASETNDIVLRIHYLTFVLLMTEPRGRAWIEVQRELSVALRAFVDGCRHGATTRADGLTGVYIAEAVRPLARLLERPGVLRGTQAAEWAAWIVELAEASRDLPEPDERRRELQRHRWVAKYISLLGSLPADATSAELRARALQLLDDAAIYYASEPLTDDFERSVAEAEALLRKHWGEAGTHEMKVRREVAALRRRAEFHRSTGNGMLTAHFFREARRLVEQQRQYFTDADVADLQRAEQAAHAHSAAAGEYARLHIPFAIPMDQMDLSQDTPERTVDEVVAFAIRSVPSREELRHRTSEMLSEAPLHAMISRTVISQDKVVGESHSVEDNLELDVERHAMLVARTNGAVVGITVISAAKKIGLTMDNLIGPLEVLQLDVGTREMIAVGCERLIAEDFVSAVHVLVPRFEDCLRQHLRSIGVDTTRFNADVGDGTSRTDDAPLGALLRSSLPDGRMVREYLGEDLWDHIDGILNSQTGMNLRNDVAHGLIRPPACSVETAGLALGLLYQLAWVASGDARGRNGGDADTSPDESPS